MLVNLKCDIPESCEKCKYRNSDSFLMMKDYCYLAGQWFDSRYIDSDSYPSWCPILREEAESTPVPMMVIDEHPSENLINHWIGNCPKCESIISTTKDKLTRYCRICGQPVQWSFEKEKET